MARSSQTTSAGVFCVIVQGNQTAAQLSW